MNKKQKKWRNRILISSLCFIILMLHPWNTLPYSSIITVLFALIIYGYIGYDILKKAGKGIKNRQIFDESFLMAVATIGALCLQEVEEAVAVMLFYQIGEFFQSIAVSKSRRNISSLMDIRPDIANLVYGDSTKKVSPSEVTKGSVIRVFPGEKVPIDGIICRGDSTLDTSALTGESLPIDVSINTPVLSGSINLTGVLDIETTKEFEESTVSKILELVENASSKKSRSEQFITKFARVYTPAVCIGALLLCILPPILLVILGREPEVLKWIYRSLTFLVISCPCALVISIPLTFFAGIGGACRDGILIKGSNYFETLAKAKVVLFDKTGTLTKGTFELSELHANISDDKFLEYAAYCEANSNHPIAKSIKSAFPHPIDTNSIIETKEISGKGIICHREGEVILLGNDTLMKEHNITFSIPDSIGTILHLAVNNDYCGYLVIADKIKPTTKEALQKLREIGLQHTILLTGDNKLVGESVAKELQLSEYFCNLLPQDKVDKAEELIQKHQQSGSVIFVGDGINDAPVLTRADIGVAMGALGSDAAIEAADVVLMEDDLTKLPLAIKYAKKSIAIVYENIIFAIGVKLLFLLLGAIGIANMWFAIFADVGVMVIAVINAIRALRVKG